MRRKTQSAFVLVLALAACGSAQKEPLAVPVAIETARSTALARVPGDVEEEELDEDDGQWVYEFEIAPAAGGPTQEVSVDAHTGKIVSVEVDDDGDGNAHSRAPETTQRGAG